MEIHYEAHERVIATTIPAFDSKRKTPQIQIRISEDGYVVRREFGRSGMDLEKFADTRTRITQEEFVGLINQVARLMKIASTMPVIDDSGSCEIALHHADGTHEAVSFPVGGGRKHPGKKPFDDAWRAIEAATKFNSEQDGAGQQKANTYLFGVSAALALGQIWLSGQVIDISDADSLWPWRTGGHFRLFWFILLPMALFFAAVVVVVSRWIPKGFVWSGIMVVSTVLIALTVSSIQPSQQLRSIVGEKALDHVHIERFYTGETFGEGRIYRGVLAGGEDEIGMIRQSFPNAKIEVDASSIHRRFERLVEFGCPDTGTILYDDRRAIILDSSQHRIYFEYATHPNAT